jgi:hypothetical protein
VPALSPSAFVPHLSQLLRRLTHLGLLASLGVLILLPAFDHHAAEYSPWHSHLTLSGADLPFHHEHPFAQPHHHSAGSGPAVPASGVVFAPNPLSGVVSLLAAFDQVLPSAWLVLAPLSALWLVNAVTRLLLRPNPLSLLDPPPRLVLD